MSCKLNTNSSSQFSVQQVWSHFDAGSCPGSAVGVRCRLDNGCSGFIHIKNLSDKKVIDPLERVKVHVFFRFDRDLVV